jgi:hypothetical protein
MSKHNTLPLTLRLLLLCLPWLIHQRQLLASEHFFDFNQGIPPGSETGGRGGMPQWSATGGVNNSGMFRLTNAGQQQGGSIMLPDLDPGVQLSGFDLRLKVYIGGGPFPADGFYLGLSNAVHSGYLEITCDTYHNGNGDAIAVDISTQGNRIGRVPFQVSQGPGGPVFLEMRVLLEPDGTLDLSYNGISLYTNFQTGLQPAANNRFWFGAQTGALYDNHWIDDVHIVTTPYYLAPAFAVAPGSRTLQQGQNSLLAATAVGTGTLTWHWSKDALPIPGATGPTLAVNNAQPWNAGNYSITVTNGTDSATTSAKVDVSPFPFNVWQGLAAYYPLNETQPGFDAGPLANHATNAGTGSAPDFWGRNTGARRFTAAEGDGMSAPGNTLFNNVTGFTWTAWVKTSGIYASTSTRILSLEGPDGSGEAGFGLSANSNGRFGAGLNWGGGNQGLETTVIYPANVWRHLAATFDGSRLRLYVDGVQAGTRLYTGGRFQVSSGT